MALQLRGRRLRAAYLGQCQSFADYCTFSLAPECSSLSQASPLTHTTMHCRCPIHAHGLDRFIQHHAERFR